MTAYKVTSARLAGFKPGDTATDNDLEGRNVPALIAAGHLVVVEAKKSRKSAPEESEAD